MGRNRHEAPEKKMSRGVPGVPCTKPDNHKPTRKQHTMSDNKTAELIAKARQRVPKLPRESLSNQERLMAEMADALESLTAPTELAPPFKDLREPTCVAAWPECFDGGYDPGCCRFPKSCSVRDIPDEPSEKD